MSFAAAVSIALFVGFLVGMSAGIVATLEVLAGNREGDR